MYTKAALHTFQPVRLPIMQYDVRLEF